MVKKLANARLALALVAVLAVVAPPPAISASKPSLAGFQPQALVVTSRPIELDSDEPKRASFGKLNWLGGLELTSRSPVFGGLSGFAIKRDGIGFVAVSDAGLWLTGALAYRDGHITGLTNVRAGPLRAIGGKALEAEDDRDAEAITWARDGKSVYIGFEHHHRIERVALKEGELGSPLETRTLPKTAQRAHPNGGIEALGQLTRGPSAGWLIAFSERQRDKAGNHRGWLIGPRSSKPIGLKRLKGFDVTDLAVGPDGDIFVLERRFRFSEGVKMRIRKVQAADVRPGATLTGEVLLEADGRLLIDNMEGIAAHRSANGSTVLTLVSDNNFSRFLQRTLLMQFALPPRGRDEARR